MKTEKEVNRKLALSAIVIIAICMLLIILQTPSHAQSPQARDHAKLQHSVSFEARMKHNQGFTMSSAKEGLKQAKKQRKETAKRERYYNRVEAIRNKTLALK